MWVVESESYVVGARVEAFYERYRRAVLGRARLLLGDGDAAKDAAQEVFLRLITSEARIFDQPSPASWLYRVTTNLCLNWMRDEKRRKELLVGRDLTTAYESGTTANHPEARALVLQIVRRMPSEMQEVAVYRFVDEMTLDEIAGLVGISPRTVGNRLVAFQQRMAVFARQEQAA